MSRGIPRGYCPKCRERFCEGKCGAPSKKRVVWLLEFDGDFPRQPVLAFETRDGAQAYAAKVAPLGHPGESPSWREHDIDCWTLEGSSYSGEMSIGKAEVFK